VTAAALTQPTGASVDVALRAIYSAEFGYVWNCLRRLGVQRSDLEDLCQEVFIRAYQSFARYDPARPLRPWLFGIALRVATDFRKLARHTREVGGESPHAPDEAANPHEAAEGSEQRRLVLAALHRLEIDRRTVFILHELDGYTMPEISLELGVPLNTCYSRLRLARAGFAEAVTSLREGQT
jgi:RNA polymerase sigma-70 factor, ECF subfamily